MADVGQTAVDAFGGVDCLVNTTGVLWFDRDRSLVDMDMDVWDQVLQINLKSHALTARHAIPEMIKSGGGAFFTDLAAATVGDRGGGTDRISWPGPFFVWASICLGPSDPLA